MKTPNTPTAPTAPAAKVRIHKSIDPTWPRWAVVGKTADTQWFKTLAEAEAFAGFKYEQPKATITIPLAEHAALVAMEGCVLDLLARGSFKSNGHLAEEAAKKAVDVIANLAAVRGEKGGGK